MAKKEDSRVLQVSWFGRSQRIGDCVSLHQKTLALIQPAGYFQVKKQESRNWPRKRESMSRNKVEK